MWPQGLVKDECKANRKSHRKKKQQKKHIWVKGRHYSWSKEEGTEGWRIIASISRGRVGDGGAGISLSSSQSNGIYVQRGTLQQGNKYRSPPVTHCHSLASYSPRHLSIFAISVFIFPFPRSSFSFSFFAAHSFNRSHKERGKDARRLLFFFLFFFLVYDYIHSVHCGWCGTLAQWCSIHSMWNGLSEDVCVNAALT